MDAPARLGVVVIGRNEGERLHRCLKSVVGAMRTVVYVDSGSSDGSVAMATAMGAVVSLLDLEHPFTAARARNEGVRRLVEADPLVEVVQFVDGDCEVACGWLKAATIFLSGRPEVAVVCGRRRERFPERSVYNLLCDMEWNTAIGAAKACGGDATIRLSALHDVGGYRSDLIAGEEPELCVRLRSKGWQIWRLDQEMTRHDASITRFGQWWRRTLRAGYAYGQGAYLHGEPPERHWVREGRSALLWGVGLPVVILIGAWMISPLLLFGLCLYPVQVLRLFLTTAGNLRSRAAYSFFLVLGKFPEAAGLIKFVAHRAFGASGGLIEYK